MAEFNLYLRDKSKESETPITLFIRYNSHTVKYPTKEKVLPKLWNDKRQAAKETSAYPANKILNSNISYVKLMAEKAFGELKLKLGRHPMPFELKNQLDIDLKRVDVKDQDTNKPITLIELFERFIIESQNGIRLTSSGKRYDKRTIQKYQTTKKRLSDFASRYHLTFETINKDFYEKYVSYLNGKGFKLNSVGKDIMVLKTFLTYATENGYNSNMYFKSSKFKSHSVTGFSIYLNENELEQIYLKDFSTTPHLEKVRDLFLVGAWTGLRFSDFTNIKPENIQDDYLHIKTAKTGERVVIPIHKIVRSIMAKYEDKYPNNLPPSISNQKMNEYLKDIAKEIDCLKIDVEVEYIKGGMEVTETKKKWELVTTHTARRSFATNVYKSGFPAISLMKITGHRTESAFLKYIKVTPEDNAHQLAALWSKSNLKVV